MGCDVFDNLAELKAILPSLVTPGVTDHGALTGLSDDDHAAIYAGLGDTESITGTWTFGALVSIGQITKINLYAVGDKIHQRREASGPFDIISETTSNSTQASALRMAYARTSGASPPTNLLMVGEARTSGSVFTTLDSVAFRISQTGKAYMRRDTTPFAFGSTGVEEEVVGLGSGGSYSFSTGIQTWGILENYYSGLDNRYADNIGAYFGDGYDSRIWYDATDLNINPRTAGSGNVLIPAGGIGIGASPTTTEFNRILVDNLAPGGATAYRALDVVAVATGINATINGGVVCESRYSSTTATSSRQIVGGRFSSFQVATRTSNGGFIGGQFLTGVSGGQVWTADNSADAYAGQFLFRDGTAAGTNRKFINIHLVDIRFDSTMNKRFTFNNRLAGVYVDDLTDGTPPDVASTDFIYAMYVDAQNGANAGALHGNVAFGGGDWNTGHLQLDTVHIWKDTTNTIMRFNGAAPTATTSGAGFGTTGETGAQVPTLSSNLPAAAAATASATWIPVWIGATKGWIPVWQ